MYSGGQVTFLKGSVIVSISADDQTGNGIQSVETQVANTIISNF